MLYQMQAGDRAVLEGPGGSITIDGSGITLDAVAINIKGPMKQASGGKNNMLNLLSLPVNNPVTDYSEQFLVKHTRSEALADILYCAETAEGQRFIGRTDSQGMTARVYTSQPREVVLRWGREAALYLRKHAIED